MILIIYIIVLKNIQLIPLDNNKKKDFKLFINK